MEGESRRQTRNRLLFGGVVLALLWVACARVGVPALIRSAWAGQSLPLLNSLIEGRDVHSAAYYVALWYRFALVVTAGMLAAAVATAIGYRYRQRISRVWNGLVRRPATIGWGGLLTLGIAFGFATGLVEAVPPLIRAAFSLDPDAPPVELIWMAPLAAAIPGLLAALFMAFVLRAGRGVSIRLVSFLFGAALLYTMLASLSIGLHRIAIVLLALGGARVLSAGIESVPQSFLRVTRIATAAAVGICMLLGAGMVAWERATERQALASAGQAPDGAPNVLFLILDTVRARSLSLYGYERSTTPQLERWLADGTVFDNAIAPTSWTLPSHASMFTGRPPNELSTDFNRALDDAEPTLAEELSQRGYATGGFVANLLYTTRRTGLDRGFMRYEDDPRDLGAFLASSRWTRTPVEAFRAATGNHGRLIRKDAHEVGAQFTDWLDRVGDRPFFAFLNYFDAHSPYETKPPFDVQFRATPPRYWLMKGWSRGYAPDALQEFTDAYDATIAYMDDEIGKLLDELERRGILDNTLLVVVADHGESLGEHDILIHANSLYREQIHVPLAMRFPGRVPAGLRIEDPVSLVDLPATALDLAGFDVKFDGLTLARHWTESNRVPADLDIGSFSELTYNRFAHPRDPIQRGLMRSIVRGEWHYILNGDDVEELYDYRTDPFESVDLAGSDDFTTELVALRHALQAHLGAGTDLAAARSR